MPLFTAALSHISVKFIMIYLKIWALKAALVHIFISTINQMTTCNVKGIARCDECTKNYYLTSAVPIKFTKHLSVHCFAFKGHNFNILIHSHPSHQPLSASSASGCFSKEKAQTNPFYAAFPTLNDRQTKLATGM